MVGMGDRSATGDRADRLAAANELIAVIASCGRHFFRHGDRITRLVLDARGRVWLVDRYTRREVYTHYRGRWKQFSEGGTLQDLVCHLRDFVTKGKPVPARVFGPWDERFIPDGDLWGYGREAMQTVRDAAARLVVIPAARGGW
jgi:hypothetical protein